MTVPAAKLAEGVRGIDACFAESAFARTHPNEAATRRQSIREQSVLAKHVGFEQCRTAMLALVRDWFGGNDDIVLKFDLDVMAIANPFGVAALDACKAPEPFDHERFESQR